MSHYTIPSLKGRNLRIQDYFRVIEQNKGNPFSLSAELLKVYLAAKRENPRNFQAFFRNSGLSFCIRSFSFLACLPTSSNGPISAANYSKSIHHNDLVISLRVPANPTGCSSSTLCSSSLFSSSPA